jgi:glycosyltransferase involved in cell wall biosynthesis
MSRPSIGVVIPARDAGRYIAETIESVLAQSAPAAQILVVDDGSSDDTARIAAGFGDRVRVEQQPPTGPAAARNRGLAMISADLVALLDADDIWPSDSLEVRVAALEADPSVDLCFGHMIQFASPELPPQEQRRVHVDPRPQAALSSSAMLARRTVFDRVGPLPDRRAGDFLEWLIGARSAGVRWLMLGDVVLRRRLHLHNLSRREPEANAHYLAIVRAELARRRTAGEA